MRPDIDVAVIGSGIIGVASALNCLLRSYSVALIDDSEPEEAASFGNAGVISRGSILPVAMPSLRRKWPLLALNRDPALRIDWPVILQLMPWMRAFWRSATQQQVEHCAGALNPLCAMAWDEHHRVARLLRLTHLIERKGWLKLYRTAKSHAASASDNALLAHHGVRMETLDGAEVARLEPSLTRSFARGILFPETGFIRNPGALVSGWRDGVRQRGGRLVSARVASLEPKEQIVLLHLSTGEKLAASHVVVAAGAASGDLLKPLGFDLPLGVERGYHRNFCHPDGGPQLERPVYDADGGYIVAPMEQGVRILSGVELSTRTRPKNFSQIEAVVQEARGTLAFGAAQESQPWMGCRPSLPDSMPAIGALPGFPRILPAFGHGHMGMSLGPVTGLIVSELIAGLTPSVDPAPFAPQRFLP